jgi:RNA polymerase sigma-70 factor (ECF subfamily)
VLPIDYGAPADPLAEEAGEPRAASIWLEPYPDETLAVEDGYAAPHARYEQREAVELAFVALQHLPPRQRAVLILRDVLSLSAREVSQMLRTSVASVNSALQRARKSLDERLSENEQSTMRSPREARVGEIVRRFIDASERGDVDAIVRLLVGHAPLAMRS